MKKHRSIISQASEAAREKIVDALRNGASYRDAAALFQKLTGKRISQMAVKSFYDGEYSETMEKIRAARLFAQQLDVAGGGGRDFAKGFNVALGQRVMEFVTDPNPSMQNLRDLGRLFLDSQRAQIEEQRLKLDADKFSAGEKSKIEAGLEELGRQAKGNKRVLAALQQARELLQQESEGEA